MTERPPFADPAHMPRWMTIPEWRALVHATNTGWLSYVFPPYWLWLNILGLALLIWMDAKISPADESGVALAPFVHFRPVVEILCWTTSLHALCRHVDWSGKRKLARRVGLPPAVPDHP